MTFGRVFVLVGAVALYAVGAVAHAADQEPILENKIVLGKVVGRIDHLGVDLPRKRLLVAELGNNSVAVIDLTKGMLCQAHLGFARAPRRRLCA